MLRKLIEGVEWMEVVNDNTVATSGYISGKKNIYGRVWTVLDMMTTRQSERRRQEVFAVYFMVGFTSRYDLWPFSIVHKVIDN